LDLNHPSYNPIRNRRRSPNGPLGISSRGKGAHWSSPWSIQIGVLGPVLGPDYSTSILFVKRLLDGAMPGCREIWFGAVDARDVADLRLKATTDPAAHGERFLATGGNFVSVLQIAQILKEGAGDAARKVPIRRLPNWLIRVVALFDPAVNGVLPELGEHKNASNEKARRLLRWAPRSPRDAVLATAGRLSELGLLKAG
jgi:nucleoside-diphosphate-sugar epimerase